jgi:2,4-dienoyl-CoA reductase-like NADH-dependent reductase (Old Yellow Enzyme family)
MSQLFSTYQLRDLKFRNRVFVSPMCQYSATDGLPNDWHLVHLGSRAVGGAALVMVEATAVVPEGRISYGDLGIWSDAHVEAFRPITRFIREHGAVPAIQLAHAGRKASSEVSWKGGKPIASGPNSWQTVAPSAVAFDQGWPAPRELGTGDLAQLISQFETAARRSLAAGFDVIEIHMAHGYLFHEFLSPLSNQRTDNYGGSLENRMRFSLEVARVLRAFWPKGKPVFARISTSDWVDGGWDIASSVELSRKLKEIGIDLIDCSSGGNVAHAKIPVGPGYQVPFAREIRKQVGVATGAVGMITHALQAEKIIAEGDADVVLLARELLRDPYWPLRAAHELGADVKWPSQYERAQWPKK